MYIVRSGFKCSETKRIYVVGEEYVGDRIEEFENRGYIEKVEEESSGEGTSGKEVTGEGTSGEEKTGEGKTEWPKHVGGGYYELSNGDKVKGKEEAVAAQAEIDATND